MIWTSELRSEPTNHVQSQPFRSGSYHASVKPTDFAKPIHVGASVATGMQISRFDAHFPENWSENQKKLRRKDRANSGRAMHPPALSSTER